MREGYCRPIPFRDTDAFRRRFELRLDMDCEDPFTFELWSRYDRRAKQVRPIFIDVWTRCRKCDACRKRKAMYWSGRARTEFDKSPATYMVTLTMRPEVHYHFDAVMHRNHPELAEALRVQARDTGLAAATLFRFRAQTVGAEVQKYLKRIRLRAPYRYLQVAEAHKESGSAVSGRPHFHLLVHEQEMGALVHESEYRLDRGYCTRCSRWHTREGELCDHAFVRYQWAHGHTKVVRCMDAKSAMYLCKYVSKSLSFKVRASQGYGEEGLDTKAGLPQTRNGYEVRPEGSES